MENGIIKSKWTNRYFCANCFEVLTDKERAFSNGKCPYCEHKKYETATILDVVYIPFRGLYRKDKLLGITYKKPVGFILDFYKVQNQLQNPQDVFTKLFRKTVNDFHNEKLTLEQLKFTLDNLNPHPYNMGTYGPYVVYLSSIHANIELYKEGHAFVLDPGHENSLPARAESLWNLPI